MFNMNLGYNRSIVGLIIAPMVIPIVVPIIALIVAPIQINMYILVSHTNGRSIKNTIDMVMNRLVGMGLK